MNKNNLHKHKEVDKEKYSKKELVDLAAGRFADILVRHINNEKKKNINS